MKIEIAPWRSVNGLSVLIKTTFYHELDVNKPSPLFKEVSNGFSTLAFILDKSFEVNF